MEKLEQYLFEATIMTLSLTLMATVYVWALKVV